MPDDLGARSESAGDAAPRRNPSERALDAIRPLANLPVFFKLTGGGSRSPAVRRRRPGRPNCSPPAAPMSPCSRPRRRRKCWRRRRAIRKSRFSCAPGSRTISPARRWRSPTPPAPRRPKPSREAARGPATPVNVIDQPEFCDFSFGTIVNRSPLVIGISTDGAAPVFGQALRARIEALIPANFAAWAQAAKEWRPQFSRTGRRASGSGAISGSASRRSPSPAPAANPPPRDLDGLMAGRGRRKGATARGRWCWSAAARATPNC